MQYKIVWLLRAIKDLQEIRQYIEIEEQAPEAAARLIETIYEAAVSLSTMPNRFQVDPEKPKYRRFVVVSSYSIFYQVKNNVVYIATIWHNFKDKKSLE